jgi:hypothetical protein
MRRVGKGAPDPCSSAFLISPAVATGAADRVGTARELGRAWNDATGAPLPTLHCPRDSISSKPAPAAHPQRRWCLQSHASVGWEGALSTYRMGRDNIKHLPVR